jgi:hypothetical protein
VFGLGETRQGWWIPVGVYHGKSHGYQAAPYSQPTQFLPCMETLYTLCVLNMHVPGFKYTPPPPLPGPLQRCLLCLPPQWLCRWRQLQQPLWQPQKTGQMRRWQQLLPHLHSARYGIHGHAKGIVVS